MNWNQCKQLPDILLRVSVRWPVSTGGGLSWDITLERATFSQLVVIRSKTYSLAAGCLQDQHPLTRPLDAKCRPVPSMLTAEVVQNWCKTGCCQAVKQGIARRSFRPFVDIRGKSYAPYVNAAFYIFEQKLFLFDALQFALIFRSWRAQNDAQLLFLVSYESYGLPK